MKRLTSSVSSFEEMIRNGYLYVDKTEYIWRLIEPPLGSYFLSRPRRFGKSLTVSTLEAVFQGNKDLFKDLAIYNKPYDWTPFPVIHLSFWDYGIVSDGVSELPDYLMRKVQIIGEKCGIHPMGKTPGLCFGDLIDKLSAKSKVVILIDEYDKPILDNISNPRIKEIQQCLKGFYGVLKDRDTQVRFLFITGVSKFSHVSLFSGMNNLSDITMDAKYACMLGYTQEELEANFSDRIQELAGDCNLDEFKDKIKEWYNGYRFHSNSATVYNPVSLAKFFESSGEFNNYWFSTGTPSFLLELIAKKHFDLEDVLQTPVTGVVFDAFEVDNMNPLTLLLQTGYLTIGSTTKRYDEDVYQLRFPNREVKGSFETYLAGYCSGLRTDQIKESVFKLADAVTAGDVDGFMEAMKVFFAKVPYDVHLKDENNFQLLFFAIFMLLGISIEAESKTNNGRIDAVAANDDYVFVFEFKLDKNEQIAMDQIKDRDYCRRYMNSGKKIILIGVNFDKDAGQIADWKVMKV